MNSISALAFTDKMTKKINCNQETTGTPVFMPQTVCQLHHYLNSHFPLLTCCAAETEPHPLPPNSKLQPPHLIKSQSINQAALTIQNGCITTPGFNMRKADGNFCLCPKTFPNVRTILGLLGQIVQSKFQSS